MRLSRTVMVAAVAVAALMGTAAEVAAQMKPDEIFVMRRGLKQAVKLNFGAVAAVAKGDAQYSSDTAAAAENLAALARIAPQGWMKGSEKIDDAKTAPAAFGAKAADFQQGWKTLEAETAKLAEVAHTNSVDAIKAQVGAVQKACKGCHDDFREK